MDNTGFCGHVVIYTDAGGVGGAEISAANLVAATLATSQTRFTVVGVATEVVAAIAAGHDQVDQIVLDGPLRMLDHWRTFRRLAPDIIHLNLCTPWAGATALAAAFCTPARVVRVDQLPLRTTDLIPLLRTRLLSLRVDAHVAVGQGAATLMENFYALGRGSVIAIPNGVPDRSPNAQPPKVTGPLHIGSVGRLDPMKGHDLLLRAIAQVPDATLTILGEGGWRSHLEQMAQDLGVAERVALPGWVNPQDHPSQFDVVVQPSRSEGFPLAIVEAMLAARPVVAMRVGSVAEAVRHGETGLLVAKNDVAGLVAALQQMQQPGVAARLGQRGRAVAAQQMTAVVMATAYGRLWQQLCDRPRAPRFWVGRPKD